jgi:hypothetical protein
VQRTRYSDLATALTNDDERYNRVRVSCAFQGSLFLILAYLAALRYSTAGSVAGVVSYRENPTLLLSNLHIAPHARLPLLFGDNSMLTDERLP